MAVKNHVSFSRGDKPKKRLILNAFVETCELAKYPTVYASHKS